MPRRIDEMSKEEIARVVAETAASSSDGYHKNHCPHCKEGAVAASNVGYFILASFGYSHEEITAMYASVRKEKGLT